jgi:hypothetical protein
MASQMKDYSYAEQSIEKAVALAPTNPDVLTAAARIYRDDGKTGKATEYYKLAVAATTSSVGATGAMAGGALASEANTNPNPFAGLPGQRGQSTMAASATASPVAEVPQVFAQSAAAGTSDTAVAPRVGATPASARYMPRAGPPRYVADASPDGYAVPQARPFDAPAGGYPQAAAQAQARPQLTVQDELNQLLAERSPRILAGLTVREHTGASGTSQLTDVQTPTEMRYPVNDGMLSVRVTPTTLSAGKVSNNYGTASQFGGGPVAALKQRRDRRAISALQVSAYP